MGAGSAGAVVASRLGAAGARVLVLEAGGEDASPFLHVPAGLLRLPARCNWSYPGEPDPSRPGMEVRWPAGRVVGGGSAINGMLWVRGHRADYDGWAALGCDGWDFDAVLPYFRRTETADRPSAHRGSDGPLRVASSRVHHPLTDAFVAAACEVGIPFNDDYNGARQEGVALAQQSQRRGLRHSTGRAYLAPARLRRQVTVRTGAVATRVLVERGRAVGVEYLHRGAIRRAMVDGEVIVSAGSLASPKLLQLSGIGPADELRRLGIEVAADVAGVGRNLQEHLWAMLQFEVDVDTFNQETGIASAVRHGVDLVARGRGVATSGAAHAVVFDRFDAGAARPDHEIVFAPFALRTAIDEGAKGHDLQRIRLATTRSVTAQPSILHPRSRGSVTLRSLDPRDPPVIRMALAGDDGDVATLVRACERVREIFRAGPLRRHVVRELVPGPAVDSPAGWEAFIRVGSFGGAHPAGTCAMGVGDDSVVDPKLRVRGVDGLRVIDASVMPLLPSGNTNASVIMIGERGADLVLGR